MTDGTDPGRTGFEIGSKIADYRLDEQIGRGGMAVVYRAEDERLGRRVALKILAPELARDAAFRQRFMRESRAAAAVDHPNIIPIYDAGDSAGSLFIAMRYVQGGDVRGLLSRLGPLPPARTWRIIVQVASALDTAHAHGLVHRDVKPANMLLDASGDRTGPIYSSDQAEHVYLSDFGISKQSLGTELTSTGQFVGTLDYIAPEQIEGRKLDGRADLYSLGCAAFELLTGTPPFQREQGVALMYAQLSEAPPTVTSRRPELPPAVDPVIGRALAKNPAERYQSCMEFAADLGRALGISANEMQSPGLPLLPPPPAPATNLVAQGPGAAAPPGGPPPPPPPGQQAAPGQPQGPGQAQPTGQPQMPGQPQPTGQPWPPGQYPPNPADQPSPGQPVLIPTMVGPATGPTGPAMPPAGPATPPVQSWPGGPGQPPGQGWPTGPTQTPPRRRKGLTGVLIAVIAVAAAVAITLVIIVPRLNSKSNSLRPPSPTHTTVSPTVSPSPTNSPTTSPTGSPTTSPSGLAASQATALNNVLQTGTGQAKNLNTWVTEVSGCTNVSAAAANIQQIESERSSELAAAEGLTTSALPNGSTLMSELTQSLTYSLDADKSYLTWAEQQLSSCTPGTQGSAWDTAFHYDTLAKQSKIAFVRTWNPVAIQFSLPTWTWGQI